MGSRLKSLYAGLLFVGILISGCLFDSTAVKGSGTGDETTNGISGLVTNGQGPASGVSVSLFSKNYVPVDQDHYWQVRQDAVTDKSGRYQFRNLKKGEYNILASQKEQSLGAILQGITVLTDTSNVALPNAELGGTGSVFISLNELNSTDSSVLYIPGTNLYSKITKDNIDMGQVGFMGLPPGVYGDVHYLEGPGSEGFNILGNKLSVAPGMSLVPGPYAAWSHSADIHINTTATGANVGSDLYDFPLMVKLTAANFSFAEANSKGNDLRIVKLNNNPLPFEIEYWDSVGQSAIVWICMDTVKGNQADQSIRMYWGNNRALPKSNGPDVFTKKSGFSGVWHLSDNSPEFIVNESSTQANGIARSLKSEIGSEDLSSPGLIGRAFNFTNHAWVDLGQGRDYINGQPAATLSGWFLVKYDPSNTSALGILNIGVGQEDSSTSTRAGVQISPTHNLEALGRALDLTKDAKSATVKGNVVPESWSYFTAIINYAADSISIYVDGTLKIVEYHKFEAPMAGSTNSKHSAIGAQDNGAWEFFTGQLDELRVIRGTSSAGWIKMCYENQKPASTVVTVGKANPP